MLPVLTTPSSCRRERTGLPLPTNIDRPVIDVAERKLRFLDRSADDVSPFKTLRSGKNGSTMTSIVQLTFELLKHSAQPRQSKTSLFTINSLSWDEFAVGELMH
jgi:hypothetical protein